MTETPVPVPKTPEEIATAAHHKLLDAIKECPEFYFAHRQLDSTDEKSWAPYIVDGLRSEKECGAICGFIFQCFTQRERIAKALEYYRANVEVPADGL